MPQIDRRAIEGLGADQQQQARELLEVYEQRLRDNPLLGYQPHPKQQTFHGSHEPLRAFLGGNRSGKTTAGILDDIIQSVDRECLPEHLLPYKRWEPPFYCRIVVPDFTSTLEGVIFQKLREWCPKDQLLGGRFDKAYEKSARKLRFKNGSEMDFLTFEQDLDKFGGAAKHRIHYDEEPPRDIRRESMMRLIDYGGDELFTMTPLHGMSWMFDEIWEPFQKGKLDEATVVVVDMDDNPYLHERTKARALAGLTKEEKEARKSGRFVHFAGTIYQEFSRNWHVLPEGPLPEGARVDVGIDPGTRHPAAVVWTYLTAEDMMVVFDELRLEGHTAAQVCEAIKMVNAKHGAHREGRQPIHADSYVIDPSARNIMHNTGRSIQSEYTDHGIVTILGQNDVIAGINRVKERLENRRLLVMANCTGIIDEFRKYRWASETRTEDAAKEKPVKRGDDLMDALRYIVMSRPFAPQVSAEEQSLSPLERAALADQRGSNYNKRKPAAWQFA